MMEILYLCFQALGLGVIGACVLVVLWALVWAILEIIWKLIWPGNRAYSDEKRLLDEVCARRYPIRIYWIDEEEGEGYYFAYLPDFGWCACGATGDTTREALESLEAVKRDVTQVYLETGEKIPEPSEVPCLSLEQLHTNRPKEVK